jgi:hypothetical protein
MPPELATAAVPLFEAYTPVHIQGRDVAIHWLATCRTPLRDPAECVPGYAALQELRSLMPFSRAWTDAAQAETGIQAQLDAGEVERLQPLLSELLPGLTHTFSQGVPQIGVTAAVTERPDAWCAFTLEGSQERVGVKVEAWITGIGPHELPSNAAPPQLYAVAALLPDSEGRAAYPVLLHAVRSAPVCDWRLVGSWAALFEADPAVAQPVVNEFFTEEEAQLLHAALSAVGCHVWMEPIPVPIGFLAPPLAGSQFGGMLDSGTVTVEGLPEGLDGVSYTAFVGGPQTELLNEEQLEVAKEHVQATLHAAGYGIPDEQQARDIAREVTEATGLRSERGPDAAELEELQRDFAEWVQELADRSARRAGLPLLLAFAGYAAAIGQPGAEALAIAAEVG